jgi:hypothetical protein
MITRVSLGTRDALPRSVIAVCRELIEPPLAGDRRPPRRAGNCHGPRGRIRVMLGSLAS